jgi:hypothetical protein
MHYTLSMKKTILFVLAALAAITCKSGPSSKNERDSYRTENYTASILLFPEKGGEGPRMDLFFSLLDAGETGGKASFFRDLLYSGDTPDIYTEKLVENYQGMYQDLRVSPGVSSGEEQPASLNWEYAEAMRTWNFGNNGLVIARDQESYTGGAHGTSTRRYYVIDTKELRLLSLEDFFRDPRSPELRRLVYNALRSYSGLAEGRPLSEGAFFEDEPELSTDFFVSEKGLGFHWNPYEIASYSEGSIEITLPWQDIQALLKPPGIRPEP